MDEDTLINHLTLAGWWPFNKGITHTDGRMVWINRQSRDVVSSMPDPTLAQPQGEDADTLADGSWWWPTYHDLMRMAQHAGAVPIV